MEDRTRNNLKQQTGWSIAIGVILIILGVIAIASPIFASVAIGLFLGWLFLIGGVFQLVDAFRHSSGSSLILKLVLGILAIIAGILLIANPWAGVISLTLVVGIYFLFDGIFRVILAFQLKPASNWGWVLVNGILMIILGILIWSQWPFSAVWILGLLVGIGLLFSGIATIAAATATRRTIS